MYNVTIQSFTNSQLSSVTYMLTNGADVYVIDPGDVTEIIHMITCQKLILTGILLTHAHYDHIYGLNELIKNFPRAKVYTNAFGGKMLLNVRGNLSLYHETPFVFEYPQNLVLIAELTEIGPLKVYETPGHNPSCLSFVTNDAIFTGDAYIPGIKTVTNLPNGNKTQAQESLQKILELATNRIIYPGHSLSHVVCENY